jgi:hypothetical protein
MQIGLSGRRPLIGRTVKVRPTHGEPKRRPDLQAGIERDRILHVPRSMPQYMGLARIYLQGIVSQAADTPKGIMSRRCMARQTKSDIKLSEAADKATALLQGLQSRLSVHREETPEDLDRQLQEYFVASDTSVLDQIRERVIDAVADRILESWERGDRRQFGTLENQVIDRVAERILERMTRR